MQTGFLGAFGGGILSALVLQQPQRAGIALFEVHAVQIAQVLSWLAGYTADLDRSPILPFSPSNEVHFTAKESHKTLNIVLQLTQDNTIGIVWTLCWWAIMYSPGDSVNRVHSLLPVRMLTKASFTPPHQQCVVASLSYK